MDRKLVTVFIICECTTQNTGCIFHYEILLISVAWTDGEHSLCLTSTSGTNCTDSGFNKIIFFLINKIILSHGKTVVCVVQKQQASCAGQFYYSSHEPQCALHPQETAGLNVYMVSLHFCQTTELQQPHPD